MRIQNWLLFCIAMAVIPCTAQSVWTQQQEFIVAAGNPYGDAFAASVAVSGDTAIFGWVAGFPGNPGQAFIYGRSGTTWSPQASLAPPDGTQYDGYGRVVAVSGDTAVVGAPAHGPNGAVYIYVRNAQNSWTLQKEFFASDVGASARFGFSVALSGQTLVASGNLAAYVFVRNGTTWALQKTLATDNPAPAVSLSGDTAIVGGKDKVYVYTRNLTVWTQQQILTASDLVFESSFSDSLSLDGDTAVIGAPTQGSAGAAYVFFRNGGNWMLQQELTAGDAPANAGFGQSAGVSGDIVVVGATSRFSTVSAPGPGAAYIFTRAAGTWTQQQELAASGAAPGTQNGLPSGDNFGGAVSVSGGTVAVGAPFRTNGVNQNTGAAYIFTAQSPVTLSAPYLAPSTGSGAGPTTFIPLYSDPSGASDIQVAYLDFGTTIFAPNSCIVLYIPGQNVLYLYNDTNNAILGPVSPTGGSTVSNSQCTLGTASGGGAATRGGTNLTVPFPITFASGFQGAKTIWGLVQSYTGVQSPWHVLGSWTPFPAQVKPPLAAVSLSPINGGGAGPQTFQATYSDPNGFNDLQAVYLDFGQSIFGANSCIVAYVQGSNQLFLYNDAGTGRVPGSITEGTSGTLSNSQCTISGAGGAVTPSGFNLTVPVNITFSPSFHGTQNVWGLAQSYSGTQSGWKLFGSWVTGIGAVSISPNTGSGFGPQTFNAVYVDPKGGTDIQVVYLDVGNSIFAPNSCIVAYVRASNSLYLFNDASAASMGPITAGSASTLSNSQCSISGLGGTAIAGGFNLTVPFSVTFANSFTGVKNIWGLAQSYSGAQSGWPLLGTWTP